MNTEVVVCSVILATLVLRMYKRISGKSAVAILSLIIGHEYILEVLGLVLDVIAILID